MFDNTKKRLSIVIINYKTVILTLNCLKSLIKQIDKSKDHIIIVDNNSGGKDIKVIKKEIENNKLSDTVTLILSPENNGFSSGNNIGINAINSEYYLLVNNDTLFQPKAIDNFLLAIEKYPNAGIISPRLECYKRIYLV